MFPLMIVGFAIAVIPLLVGTANDRQGFSEAPFREVARNLEASDDHARLVMAAQRT